MRKTCTKQNKSIFLLYFKCEMKTKKYGKGHQEKLSGVVVLMMYRM